MTITPAYGRDYKSAKDATYAFNHNRDFIVAGFNLEGNMNDNGRTVNKQDLKKGNRVTIRYARLTKIVNVVVD